MWVYTTTKERYHSPEIGEYTAYGITIYRVGFKIRKVLSLADVSVDRALVRRIAWDCTCGQLAPVQLLDVIRDRI